MNYFQYLGVQLSLNMKTRKIRKMWLQITKTFLLSFGATFFFVVLFSRFEFWEMGTLLVIAGPICLILSWISEKYFSNQKFSFKFIGTVILVSAVYVIATSLVFIGGYFYLFYTKNNFVLPIGWCMGSVLARYLIDK